MLITKQTEVMLIKHWRCSSVEFMGYTTVLIYGCTTAHL